MYECTRDFVLYQHTDICVYVHCMCQEENGDTTLIITNCHNLWGKILYQPVLRICSIVY